jgi:hypothetical protein
MVKKMTLLLLLALLSSSNIFSQISFSAEFESGSLGKTTLIDSVGSIMERVILRFTYPTG